MGEAGFDGGRWGRSLDIRHLGVGVEQAIVYRSLWSGRYSLEIS